MHYGNDVQCLDLDVAPEKSLVLLHSRGGTSEFAVCVNTFPALSKCVDTGVFKHNCNDVWCLVMCKAGA